LVDPDYKLEEKDIEKINGAKETLPPPAKQITKRNVSMNKYGIVNLTFKNPLRIMDFEKLMKKEIMVSNNVIN